MVKLPIYKAQNQDKLYNWHRAKDAVYQKSELFWKFSFYSFMILGVLGVAFNLIEHYLMDSARNWVELLSFFIPLIIGLLLKNKSSNLKRIGAILQEGIDVELYAISWKDSDMKNKFNGSQMQNTIIEYEKKSKKPKEHFKNWYSESTGNFTTREEQVFACQRENLWFDINLRIKYISRLITYLFIIILVSMIIGLIVNMSFLLSILKIFLPIAPFVWLLISALKENLKLIERQKLLEKEIKNKLKKFELNKTAIQEKDLREVQNAIFEKRINTSANIPNLFYSKHRDELDDFTIETTKNLKT